MNLKEFFRPEPSKIITAVLIVVVLAVSAPVRSITMPLWAFPSLCFYILVAIFIYGAGIDVRFYLVLVAVTMTLILSMVLYWYLLSCTIVFIFKFLKKRCPCNALEYRPDPKMQLAYGLASSMLTFLIVYFAINQVDWLVALIVGISNFIVAGFYITK